MNPKAPEWIIIYDGGDTLSSWDCSWEEAPPHGIQAVVYQSVETGWSIANTGDYYIRREGEIIPVSESGLVDYALNVWRLAKQGRMLSRHEWGQVSGQAAELMRGVKKTAYFKGELGNG